MDDKFEKNWEKFDVNHSGFIDTTEAFQFTRQLMGTFTSLMDSIDSTSLSQGDLSKSDPALEADLASLGF